MYQYFDLDDTRFENLVIAICKEILGQGVQGFSAGRDGGKDGEFNGKADNYPSKQGAWEGKIIIQAKHTLDINKHFLESDFYSENSNTNILAQEVVKVKKMFENKELDYYMLFSNRKLTGGAKPTIINYISQKTGLKPENIAVFGNGELDYYLSRYSYIVNMKNINLEPLNISPIISLDSLAEVIGHLSEVFNDKNTIKDLNPIIRTNYEQKNKLNNLTDEMSKQLQKYYMKDVFVIKKFLNDPQNRNLLSYYQDTVEEFQLQYIIPKQKEIQYFDEIYNDLVRYLLNRDYVLKSNKHLTRLMVFYMYWNCDIGKSNDDSSK